MFLFLSASTRLFHLCAAKGRCNSDLYSQFAKKKQHFWCPFCFHCAFLGDKIDLVSRKHEYWSQTQQTEARRQSSSLPWSVCMSLGRHTSGSQCPVVKPNSTIPIDFAEICVSERFFSAGADADSSVWCASQTGITTSRKLLRAVLQWATTMMVLTFWFDSPMLLSSHRTTDKM